MSSQRWFSALLFAGIAFSFAHAQRKATETPIPSTPDFSKEAYVIEHLDSRIRAEQDGTGTREVTAQIRVLADAGVKAFAVLSFTYTSANEVVEIDYVRVRKPDGTVVKTPDYNIQDMPGEVTRTAPLYSDIHEKHVAVKGLAVGDVLEYLVRYRIVKPQVPGQFWQEYSFTKSVIAKDERLEISFPRDKYVKIVSPEFKPAVTEENDRKMYRWTHSNLIVKEKDPHEIPRRIPPNPNVQVTTFRSWEEVGRWYADLQKEPLQVTPAIQSKANELTKGLTTEDEKIRAIYNFVSLQIHYIGLDFGIGRYQPHAADDVLDDGYGDCKDKHTLVASLLKAVGIDVWPVLIHATRKLDPDVPSPAQFNHVITVVPQGDKYLWLDTTPEVAPYGLLLLTLRGKQALVVPSNRAAMLMTTPENAPFPQVQSMSMEGKLSAEGTFTGHTQQSYRGDMEAVLRSLFRQVSQSQWKEAVQRFSYGLNFGGDVSNVNLTPPDDLSKPFDLSYDYERKHYTDWDNRQITPPMPPMGIESYKDLKKPPEPLLLGGLGEVTYRSKITLPPGYSAAAPENVDLVRPYAEYHAAYSIENGVYIATRRFVIRKNEVELSSWDDFVNFTKAISDDENKFMHLSGGSTSQGGTAGTSSADVNALFREGTDALQQRDFTRAEEAFRKVIAADSQYRGAHFNLGLAIASQGRMPDAISEFRKEEDVSPNDERAYQIAATYSMYMNRKDDAIQDWTKLLKVDPKNRDAALKLSGLLQGAGKNPEACTVLEEAVKQSPGSPSLEMALGDAYITAGEPDKGVQYLNQAIKDDAGPQSLDLGMLNNAAYLLATKNTHLEQAKGFAEKAIAELDARSTEAAKTDDPSGLTLANEYGSAWDTLGWVDFLMGDLNGAEDYLRAAWVLGQNGVSGDHLGQVLAKLGKKDEAEDVYVQALSAQYVPDASPANVPADRTQAYSANRNAILSHYEKLTGRRQPPAVEIKRLPNGEWTKTPSDELVDKRRTNVTRTWPNASGICDFEVVFSARKIEGVRYLKGDESLRGLGDKIEAAHFEMVFPHGSEARIFRRITLTCSPSSGCNAEMIPPGQAAIMTQ